MKGQAALSRFLSFFLTKIIIGFAFVGGFVALAQWTGRSLNNFIHPSWKKQG